jgi:hypothetical protein
MRKGSKRKVVKPKAIELKPSDLYEQAFQAIAHHHREELGYGWVEGSKDYPGKLSQDPRGRQIDATIHLPNGEIMLVECKRWDKKVNVQYVEGFDAKVRIDIGLNVGLIMVSTIGFSKSAIKYAKARNIRFITLNATATKDEYILKMDSHGLMGFLDSLEPREEISLRGELTIPPDSVQLSEEVSFPKRKGWN